MFFASFCGSLILTPFGLAYLRQHFQFLSWSFIKILHVYLHENMVWGSMRCLSRIENDLRRRKNWEKIYRTVPFYCIAFICSHEILIITKRMTSWTQEAEMSFVLTAPRLSLRNNLHHLSLKSDYSLNSFTLKGVSQTRIQNDKILYNWMKCLILFIITSRNHFSFINWSCRKEDLKASETCRHTNC